MTPRYTTAPAFVAACDLGPDVATVLVDYRAGSVQILVDAAARWWRQLAATGDVTTPTALDPRDGAALLHRLIAAGLLATADKPTPWPVPTLGQPWRLSFGTQELQAGTSTLPRVPVITLFGAILVLTVVIAALSLGHRDTRMARLLRLVTWAQRHARQPATTGQAERAVHAVRRVGRLLPSRVACLEESASIVLLLTTSGRTVTWCHGIAADPIKLHAWIETEHGPVAEPSSTDRYTAIRTIPPRKGDHD